MCNVQNLKLRTFRGFPRVVGKVVTSVFLTNNYMHVFKLILGTHVWDIVLETGQIIDENG